MRTFAVVLLCLACAGQGRRVEASTQPQDSSDSSETLAKMLLANSPASAFTGSIAGLQSPDGKVSRSADASMKIKNPSNALPFLEAPACQSSGLVGSEAGFDPLYLSNFIDVKWMREAELKHGRICMLASVGMIWQELYSIPGYPGYNPNPVEAVSSVPPEGLLQILATMAYLEIKANGEKYHMRVMFEDPNRKPGNIGFDPLRFGDNPKSRERLEYQELKHGRLAMLAFSGMINQVFITGKPVLASLKDIFATP